MSINSEVKHYNDYQVIDITGDVITLGSHTLLKYNTVIQNIFNQFDNEVTFGKSNIRTVLDAGCSLGGIGLKISKNNNIESVMLNNVTVSELNVSKEIAELCGIKNVIFSSDNIFDVKDRFDLTMYFALIHHLLRCKDITEILQMIRCQTNMYTVMEIPVQGDALLDNIVNASQIQNPWSTRYKALTSVDVLKQSIETVFDVIRVHEIEYGSKDLCRYVFICRIKKIDLINPSCTDPMI